MTVKFEYNELRQILTVFLCGEIDHHSAVGTRSLIDIKINALRPVQLVLDFRSVSFMDSSGIGLVMGRFRSMEEIGGEVIIANPPSFIKRVMRLSGIGRIARIVDTLPPINNSNNKEEQNNESTKVPQ